MEYNGIITKHKKDISKNLRIFTIIKDVGKSWENVHNIYILSKIQQATNLYIQYDQQFEKK